MYSLITLQMYSLNDENLKGTILLSVYLQSSFFILQYFCRSNSSEVLLYRD